MTPPAYVVTFRGYPACPCLAVWLPHFEGELKRRGVVRESIDIAQLIGGAVASGGTHATGGAFDIWQDDPTTQLVGREMGAATWNRNTGSFASNRHTHGVLNGCPHNGPARYQIDALADGYSGLGAGGRGSYDTGPGPRNLRTWREGIAWAKRQGEFTMDNEAKAAFDTLTGKVDALDGKVTSLRKVEAQRFKKQITELRQQGKTSDEILALLEDA